MMRFACPRAAILALLLALSATGVRAQESTRTNRQLTRALNSLMDDDRLANAWIGVHVINLADGKTMFARDERKSFIPASNTKLYTTAPVLDQLGPDFRYETRLFRNGEIVDGVLHGNLLVRGSGDPVIGGRFTDGDITHTFRQWADSLKARGIRSISGDVVGDDDLFDDQYLGYGWMWDDEPFWYSAEISALALNDNVVDFTLTPAAPGAPATIDWEPARTNYVTVDNASLTVPADSSLNEGYERERAGNRMRVSSEVPEDYTETESISIHNPTLFFVHVLVETLRSEGIAVLGRPVDIDDLSFKPASNHLERVATHHSEPMAAIVKAVNKPSQNLYAEMLLKTLGALRPTDEDVPAGSAQMGWSAAMRTFSAADVDTSRIQLVDGSGLSRVNLIAPEMTTDLLSYMWHHDQPNVRDAFIDSLPIGGVDGSIRSRFTTGAAFQNVRAKTGTVSNASTLSGYVTTAGGRDVAFSIMINHYVGSSSVARSLQDRIVETLALYRR